MFDPLYFSLRSTATARNGSVRLSDICEVQGAPADPLADVLIPIRAPVTIVNALWAAGTLRTLYPGRLPLNVGATECRIFPQEKSPARVVVLLKTVLLATVMFFGGAVAIMTFHEDVNMPAVLDDIYAFFTGEAEQNSLTVSIPYSLGIVAGFVVLLGLVHKKKHKPTLLELNVHDQEKTQRDYLADKEDGG